MQEYIPEEHPHSTIRTPPQPHPMVTAPGEPETEIEEQDSFILHICFRNGRTITVLCNHLEIENNDDGSISRLDVRTPDPYPTSQVRNWNKYNSPPIQEWIMESVVEVEIESIWSQDWII